MVGEERWVLRAASQALRDAGLNRNSFLPTSLREALSTLWSPGEGVTDKWGAVKDMDIMTPLVPGLPYAGPRTFCSTIKVP